MPRRSRTLSHSLDRHEHKEVLEPRYFRKPCSVSVLAGFDCTCGLTSGIGSAVLPGPTGPTMRSQQRPMAAPQYRARPARGLPGREEKRTAVSHNLKLERRFDVAPEVVFDAFTDPQAQKELYADAPDWIVESQCDLRVGGRWSITFGPPGSTPARET